MTNYALNEEKMFADVTDGIAIIINSETGIYYGMNELATIIYENIINGASTETILSALKTKSNIPVNFEEDYNNFINAMIEMELVIEIEKSEGIVNLPEKIEDFSISLKEYNDAQELLLADPIHEVKEETGWTPEKSSIGYTKEETAKREMKAE